MKQKLFTIIYLQIDGQINRQNNMIKADFLAIMNFEQDN